MRIIIQIRVDNEVDDQFTSDKTVLFTHVLVSLLLNSFSILLFNPIVHGLFYLQLSMGAIMARTFRKLLQLPVGFTELQKVMYMLIITYLIRVSPKKS